MNKHTHGFSIGVASDDEDQPVGVSIIPAHPGTTIVLDVDQAMDHGLAILMAAQTVRSMLEIGEIR